MSKSPPSADHPAAKLVERLHAVIQQNEGQPAPRRRSALMREIDLQLAGLPPADRPAVLEQALGVIRPATRPAGGDSSGEKLLAQLDLVRGEKETLAKERDALRATRDALLRENAKMRGEIEAKKTVPSTPGVAGGSLETFRAGLKDAIAGKKVDADKLGLSAGDVRLFRLTQELVNFVYMLERGRIDFLNKVEVGQAGMMGTQLVKGYQDQVRKQFLAVLNDQEGSIRNLRRTMDGQTRFIVGVPESFQEAIPRAVEAILAQLAPEPILARSKRLMTDYERAWSEFARIHSDLSNLTPEEIWDGYFKNVFKEKLADWTKSEG
jgi:hypothetical protein